MTGHEFEINGYVCLHYRTLDGQHVIVQKDTGVALSTANSFRFAVEFSRAKLR